MAKSETDAMFDEREKCSMHVCFRLELNDLFSSDHWVVTLDLVAVLILV